MESRPAALGIVKGVTEVGVEVKAVIVVEVEASVEIEEVEAFVATEGAGDGAESNKVRSLKLKLRPCRTNRSRRLKTTT